MVPDLNPEPDKVIVAVLALWNTGGKPRASDVENVAIVPRVNFPQTRSVAGNAIGIVDRK